uniref:Uncharacterized protein n=1 Tax=Arundo donax TaxID=35708 RepID=A0A0A9HQU5_ARUDO
MLFGCSTIDSLHEDISDMLRARRFLALMFRSLIFSKSTTSFLMTGCFSSVSEWLSLTFPSM